MHVNTCIPLNLSFNVQCLYHLIHSSLTPKCLSFIPKDVYFPYKHQVRMKRGFFTIYSINGSYKTIQCFSISLIIHINFTCKTPK